MEDYLGVENQFLFLFYFGGLVWICCVLRVKWDKECGYPRVAVRDLCWSLDRSVVEFEILYGE